MTYWVKGDKMRTDWSGTQAGYESEMKLIYDGDYAYMYMPAANMVYKYASESAMSNPGAAYAEEWKDGYYGDVSDATILAGFQAGCPGGASIDGQETVAGYSCTKFTCNAGGGVVSHTWITDDGWPIKIEVTNAEGYTYTMQYSSIELNPSISDSVFDINSVAPGVPITDLTGM
jgi:outer membrane lipoprotein-sorting protein